MGINKVNRTEDIMDQSVMVEMTKEFGGLKVFILLPVITGITPDEVKRKYAEQIDYLVARAKQPTPREMMDMANRAIPTMIERALTKEN